MPELSDFTIAETATLLQAVEKIQRNHARAVLVVQDDVVRGIVSEGDVLRAILRGEHVHTPLGAMSRSSFRYLQERDERAAFELVRKHAITLIPVVDDDFRLYDVITLHELMQSVALP